MKRRHFLFAATAALAACSTGTQAPAGPVQPWDPVNTAFSGCAGGG